MSSHTDSQIISKRITNDHLKLRRDDVKKQSSCLQNSAKKGQLGCNTKCSFHLHQNPIPKSPISLNISLHMYLLITYCVSGSRPGIWDASEQNSKICILGIRWALCRPSHLPGMTWKPSSWPFPSVLAASHSSPTQQQNNFLKCRLEPNPSVVPLLKTESHHHS